MCGDSFCVSDPDYGVNWVDLLSQEFNVINLSEVTATNLLIAQQVDYAINEKATFIIMQGTSCTRSEKRHNGKLVPFSYHTATTETTPFDESDLMVLKTYFTQFFDLELSIYQNSITIEHTLQKIADSSIPFKFDQGGFEHLQFGSLRSDYFIKFNQYRSEINLWDYTHTRSYRPYYHITDPTIHKLVANYYATEIRNL